MFVRMSLTPGMPVPPSVSKAPPAALPVRSIPGSHGWPVVGPLKDRLEYFWFQGPETFFRKRIEANKSTVFRTNVPPTFPLFTGVNPNVVAVLDCKSFAHMFDMDLVDKRDVLVGDFMPSVTYTGDIRVCAYLDTSEPQHPKVKNFAMDILKRSSKTWVSDMTVSLDTMWESIESSLSTSSSASYFLPLQKALFSFLSKCIVGADPSSDPEVSSSGHIMLDKWLAVQLLPTVNIGIAQPLEELFLHSFSYPFALVSGDYKKLYNFVSTHGSASVDRGVKEFGLTREEAIHNIIFILGFNAFGGFTVFLPSLLSQIAADTSGLQGRLREEAKGLDLGGSGLSFESVKNLELTQSVVYEALRFKPPVPLQFGRARKDFRLSSHDSAFDVKKGELLCGFQMLVMRDPNVFHDPDTFIPDRFTGSGKGMLDYLYWSNGPQTGTPTDSNKQCAGKDVVTLTATLFLAHMFRRYDSITFASSSITALQKPN